MDKQKKQLIILVVLIVVGGGFGLWKADLIGGGDEGGDAAPAAPVDPAATTPAPAAGTPVAVAPGTPSGQPVVAGAPKTEIKMPDFATFKPVTVEWKWKGIWERNQLISANWPVGDPFMVLNINVVDPERNAELQAMKDTWKIKGLTETFQKIREDIIGPDGKPAVRVTQGYVYEVWFEGVNEPFKIGQRLPDTRFKIKDIFRSHKKGIGAGIALQGDTGASLVLKLAPASRYGE